MLYLVLFYIDSENGDLGSYRFFFSVIGNTSNSNVNWHEFDIRDLPNPIRADESYLEVSVKCVH